jgi:hypothetical protein
MNNTDVVRTSLIFWQCRRSLVLCVCFVDRCLSFSTFSFGQCVVCSSSTYRFWLPLWYLQTLFILRTKIITFARQINRERNNNFFRNKNNAGQANTPVLNFLATIISFENNAELIYRVPIKVLVMWKHWDNAIAAGSDVLVIPYSNVYCETIFCMD